MKRPIVVLNPLLMDCVDECTSKDSHLTLSKRILPYLESKRKVEASWQGMSLIQPPCAKISFNIGNGGLLRSGYISVFRWDARHDRYTINPQGTCIKYVFDTIEEGRSFRDAETTGWGGMKFYCDSIVMPYAEGLKELKQT